MNIVTILASGVGARFGSNVPKQFHKINGKMVIEYVVDAILQAKKVDKILIVTNVEANKSYLTVFAGNDKVDFAEGGDTRNRSLANALEYIKSNYNCDKMIVCDAVRPMITGELIDKYFDLLDDSAAVVTAQAITDSLGCYDIQRVYRDRYYLMQSPEGFDFNLLYESFDPESDLTEVTQQLPENSKIELCFDFQNNFKLTYPADLKYLEALINARDNEVSYKNIFDSVRRLNRYLYENYPGQTKSWMRRLESEIPNMLKKWTITDYRVVKTSHFGIIFLADSVNYGPCVLKMIPPFINRYEPERSCYQSLPATFMCELYDYDDACSAILMQQMDDDLDAFDVNDGTVRDFFAGVLASYNDSVLTENEEHSFHDYSAILHSKLNENGFDYRNEEIMALVSRAVKVFDDVFGNEQYRLVHGDMHRYNIMKKDNLITAIDPIGYVAPVELDIARFIGTELTDDVANAKNKKAELVEYFAPLSSKDRIEAILFVDMVFRLHNSLFENDTFELTDKWLEILNI